MSGQFEGWTAVAQIGALGILAVVIFYSFRRLLPRILDQHFKAINKIAGSVERNSQAIRDNEKTTARLAAALFQHDATVRGQNPETLGTTEELMDRVLNGGRRRLSDEEEQ